MKANLDFLTKEQREAFAKINALLGLGPDEVTYSFSAEHGESQPHNLVFSSDPAESHVPPHFIPVGSIAELRKVAGYDDIHPKLEARKEDEVHYPGQIAAHELALLDSQAKSMKPSVSPDLYKRIEKAATAYVMLDPERVREYEPLINATLFPGKVAAFVAANLDVPPGQTITLTGPDGTVFNYGAVTVGAGGSIAVDVHCTFNCQTFTQL